MDGSLCVSSKDIFRDTLLRVTTDGGCKVYRQNYPGSFLR